MRRRGLALVLVGLMVFTVAGVASAGGHQDACAGLDGNVKFDSDVIGIEGVSQTVDGVTVTLHDWVTKDGEPDEFIGFSMSVVGGTFDLAYVKAGQDLLMFDGSMWMNTQDKVRAVSHVRFCGATIDDGGGVEGVVEDPIDEPLMG